MIYGSLFDRSTVSAHRHVTIVARGGQMTWHHTILPEDKIDRFMPRDAAERCKTLLCVMFHIAQAITDAKLAKEFPRAAYYRTEIGEDIKIVSQGSNASPGKC